MRAQRILATRSKRRAAKGLPKGFKVPEPRPQRCRYCNGSGKRAAKKNHREDCGCFACKPCSHCNGTRLEPGVLPSKQVKAIEVGEVDMTERADG